MNRFYLLWFLIFFPSLANSQINKFNNIWISGGNGQVLDFTFNPINQYMLGAFPGIDLYGNSNICDSSGDLLIITNGFSVVNKKKQIISNGDLIVNQAVIDSLFFDSGLDQAAIILPKVNNTYYIFTPTVSASEIYRSWLNPVIDSICFRYDELLYCIVDMNANNGDGLVTQKKIPLLQNTRDISITGMTATKHANGTDWWLVIHSSGGNKMWSWQVTPDTVLGPNIQGFETPHFDTLSGYGQGTFSKDGSKYFFINGFDQFGFVADFDRCGGTFSNGKAIEIRKDTFVNVPLQAVAYDNQGGFGCAFSPNNQFLYVSTGYAIKQLDLLDTNKLTQWHLVTGPIQYYNGEFKLLSLGVDDKLYIGNRDGAPVGINYIDKPNLKGAACDLKFLPTSVSFYSPPNNPNYALGMDSSICWPLSNVQFTMSNEQLKVYPNPAFSNVIIDVGELTKNNIYIINTAGQVLYNQIPKTVKTTIDVNQWANGMYFVRYGSAVKRLVVE
ncbi:MAG: hypothetical protein RLZZ118_1009 [Bacteroidota bacterium]|jgi:hypothetical protein